MNRSIYLIVTKGNLGGAQQYVLALAKAIKRNSSLVPVVVHGSGVGLGDEAMKYDIASVRIPNLSNRSLAADVLLAFRLAKVFFSDRTAVFHFNSSKVLLSMFLLSLIVPKKNIVFTCHGLPWLPGATGIWTVCKKYIFKRCLERSSSIICVSKYIETVVKSLDCRCENVSTICNVLDVERASKYIEAGRFEASNRNAISLSELNDNKGIYDLVCAIGENRSKLVGALKWDIFGDGADRVKIEKKINELGLQDTVFLKGFIREPYTIIGRYSLMFIPSKNEAFGMVALEAAAAGVYTLATEVGGLPEAVLEGSGLVLSNVYEIATMAAEIIFRNNRPITPAVYKEIAYWQSSMDQWLLAHLRTYENLGY